MSNKKAVSFQDFKDRKVKEKNEEQYYGKMVWLYCPTCNTIEYSEVISPNGRSHKCGTQVIEKEVDIDLRAELTITLYNLDRINHLLKENNASRLKKLFAKSFDKTLQKLLFSEEMYLQRLNAHGITPYPGSIEEIKDRLPIKVVNELGLYISEFRYNPEERFSRN